MLKKHSHFGDSTAAKVEFVITIESLDFVDVMKYPGSMKVEWSRANSNGKTNKSRVDYGGHAVWNQVTDFTSHMYMDKKGLIGKNIIFNVKFIKDDGKSKNVGKLSLNLADFVNFEKEEHVTKVARLINKEEKMQLRLSIKCIIIKLKLKNNKKLSINKATGQWEEGADSEWSASEAEPASCEEKSEKSSKSKSKKKSKRDDSDSDSDSDPDSEGLRAAISNYSKSVKREDEERKGRSKSPVDDDPFERHNQKVLGLDSRGSSLRTSRGNKSHSDSGGDEQNEEGSENDEECKCVLF